jgi:hypothetical protein
MSESLLKILEKQISKTLTEILISKMKNNEQIAIEENTNIKNIEKVSIINKIKNTDIKLFFIFGLLIFIVILLK